MDMYFSEPAVSQILTWEREGGREGVGGEGGREGGTEGGREGGRREGEGRGKIMREHSNHCFYGQGSMCNEKNNDKETILVIAIQMSDVRLSRSETTSGYIAVCRLVGRKSASWLS